MTAPHPPTVCPACSGALHVSELSCDACGTKVAGTFSTCEFCALSEPQRELMRLFLSSRGNSKEIERHLGVSYPTARARINELLVALGLADQAPDPRLELLESLARGDIDVDQAMDELEG